MSVDPETQAALRAAVEPTASDVLWAKNVAMTALAGGRLLDHGSLHRLLCAERGVPAIRQNRNEIIDIDGIRRGTGRPFDSDAPEIQRTLLSVAASEALGDLAAQGLVLAMHADETNGEFLLSVGGIGWGGGERLHRPFPAVAPKYRLVRGLLGQDDFRFLDEDLYLDGIIDLVGQRGARCVREALSAYRRGLFLSAANMLGASSEAAWYSLGRALQGEQPGGALGHALDADQTAQVVRLAAEKIAELGGGRIRSTVLELQAHEAYLRNLRNYGLHPREDVDDDHEGAYTDTGCGLLIMETRRYYTRLYAVATAVGLLGSITPSDQIATD